MPASNLLLYSRTVADLETSHVRSKKRVGRQTSQLRHFRQRLVPGRRAACRGQHSETGLARCEDDVWVVSCHSYGVRHVHILFLRSGRSERVSLFYGYSEEVLDLCFPDADAPPESRGFTVPTSCIGGLPLGLGSLAFPLMRRCNLLCRKSSGCTVR